MWIHFAEVENFHSHPIGNEGKTLDFVGFFKDGVIVTLFSTLENGQNR